MQLSEWFSTSRQQQNKDNLHAHFQNQATGNGSGRSTWAYTPPRTAAKR